MENLEETAELSQFYAVQEPHYSSQLRRVHCHEYECHKKGRMKLLRTRSRGLCSTFHYYCRKCKKKLRVSSHSDAAREEQNKGAVWGSIAAGLGHHQTEEFLAHMGFHVMSQRSYRKAEDELYEVRANT